MNSNSKLPESPAFFLDRSMGRRKVAAALRQAGVRVEVHDDHFPPDARDEDWLKAVGQKGWFVLTKDKRIRYRNVERHALRNAKVGAFVLTVGTISGPEMAEIFVKALPAILQHAATSAPPFLAIVRKNASVSMLSS